MLSDDIKFQILTEHYKGSFEILQNKIKGRERLFFYVLCLLITMLFQLYTPREASEIISQLVSNRLNVSTYINFSFIESVIWFSLLAMTLKYFQAVVYIERQYDYVHKLEDQISKEYQGQAFTREGLSYLKNYPFLLQWASLLYTIFFPTILTLIVILKIVYEFSTMGFGSVLFWFDGITFSLIVVSVVLYMKAIHRKKGGKRKAPSIFKKQ